MQKGIDYIGITVSYMCHDGNGNFVMSKRGQNCRDERGTWDFGGGGIDFGDTAEQTLLKELKEEYCVDPINYEFLGYYDLFREHEGKKTHWLALNFLVLVDPSQVQNGEPHKFDEVRWVRLDNLPQPLHPAMNLFIDKYKDKLN